MQRISYAMRRWAPGNYW